MGTSLSPSPAGEQAHLRRIVTPSYDAQRTSHAGETRESIPNDDPDKVLIRRKATPTYTSPRRHGRKSSGEIAESPHGRKSSGEKTDPPHSRRSSGERIETPSAGAAPQDDAETPESAFNEEQEKALVRRKVTPTYNTPKYRGRKFSGEKTDPPHSRRSSGEKMDPPHSRRASAEADMEQEKPSLRRKATPSHNPPGHHGRKFSGEKSDSSSSHHARAKGGRKVKASPASSAEKDRASPASSAEKDRASPATSAEKVRSGTDTHERDKNVGLRRCRTPSCEKARSLSNHKSKSAEGLPKRQSREGV